MKKYNLLLPIAGNSKRFLDAGYSMPKPLILAKNKHVIDWSLESVDISECNLIFIVRLEHIHNFNIDKILKQKFGEDIKIISIEKPTRGALETCLYAKDYIDNDKELVVYTPDIYFFPKFNLSDIPKNSDGFLLTFIANSSDHSYSRINQNGLVDMVAEKEIISNHANIGLYYFKDGKTFIKYASEIIENNLTVKNEFYIAPIYNLMIRDNHTITSFDTEKVHILGTPESFKFFCNNVINLFGEKPIAISSDHSGFELKEKCKKILEEENIKYIDVGTYINSPCDYSDYVKQATDLIISNECDYAISFCRSGQGVNIVANKTKGIISGLVFDSYTAKYAIKHNSVNHFSIPSKYVTPQSFKNMINIWKNTTFDGGRHFTRLKKFINLDEK